MKDSYDFTDAQRNPYTEALKQPVTIRLDVPTVQYFKELAGDLGMPYQTLINLYLRECVMERKRPSLDWVAEG